MKKILLILAISVIGLTAQSIKEGDKAPNFVLKTVKGKKRHSLRQFKGRVVLLNLWGSWCRGCKKEMPAFYRLQKAYSKRKFRVLALSIDRKKRTARRFLKRIDKKAHMKTPFIVLHDPKKSVPKKYGAKGMPSTYLIDKKGIVRLAIIGSLTDDEIELLKVEINKLM